MKELISRCGCQCHLCPAYYLNIKIPADQEQAAAGWAKYFGIEMSPDRIMCHGCFTPRANLDLPRKDCPISACVSGRGLANCGGCAEYPCATLEQMMGQCEAVALRFRALPSAEFDRFIAPYQGRRTLEALRGGGDATGLPRKV